MLRIALLYGAIFLIVGVFASPVLEIVGMTRLPGDVVIVFGTRNLTIPFATGFVLTSIAVAVLWLIRR